MNINFGPKGILQIDDARIVFRNFSGLQSKYNREGDRNFAVVIPTQEMADALIEEGWNVKIKPPREIDDGTFIFLPVKIKFNNRGPKIYLKTGSNVNCLSEDTVDCLDNIDIESVDLDIRPYDWDVNGKTGRAAYLQAMSVTQQVDRFADRYAVDERDPDDDLPW